MPKTQRTLLIIDDCLEDREIYRGFLASDPHIDYQILEASLAEAGLELFQKQPCDAILLDFQPPDMDVLSFLKALRQSHQLSYPPIIMLAGPGHDSLIVQAIKQGIQDYLVKQHLRPEVLQMALRSVIQQSQLHSLLSKQKEQQRLIATMALRIRQSLDLPQILETAVAEVQQLLECDHVGIYQCRQSRCQNSRHQNSRHSVGRQLQDQPPVLENVAAVAELGKRQNTPACCNNDASPANEDLTVPILITPRAAESTSQVWGYLVAHRRYKQTPWQVDEQSIASELAVQLAIAIQQSELLSDSQSALKESEALIQLKSRIISTISHEYRTPLAVILGSVSTLQRHQQTLSAEKRSHLLNMIQDKARHMTALVDDMLLMQQCDLKQAKFEPSPINVLQFVADLVEEQRDLASEQHELVFKVLGRTNGFWGDHALLRFALSNLLSNAVKYSPDGGMIEVGLVGKVDAIELSIRDQGIGIPTNDLPTIFESFSRASNVSTIPGTGMGLSISKSCIELHNGEISLESEDGKGTTVMVTLPKEPDVLKELYPKD